VSLKSEREALSGIQSAELFNGGLGTSWPTVFSITIDPELDRKPRPGVRPGSGMTAPCLNTKGIEAPFRTSCCAAGSSLVHGMTTAPVQRFDRPMGEFH
jgi:hypothetical protein